MKSDAKTPEEYINTLPKERQLAMQNLRKCIIENLPSGFEECINYGMIGYIVPHRLYPSGYHCDTSLPLPFMNIASQKNFIAVYHMGIYADKELMEWFINEYPKHCNYKLDMGKSCIRFKKIEAIPYELIGTLTSKMTPDTWVELYESSYKNRKK